MTNERGGNQGDQVWPHGVYWNLDGARGQTSDVLWRCDALRAGRLHSRTLFGTRAEAEQFAQKLQQSEPDQMFNVEAILANTVWN